MSSTPNPFVGTWRIVSANIEQDGERAQPFGPRPAGLLTFTPDLHFVEVLMDGDLPRFARDAIGQGTDEENRAAASRTIGIAGSYEIGPDGEFLGDTVEACTFPNWVGDVRTRAEITATVEGDRLHERFRQPSGAVITLAWERVPS